MEEKYYYKNFQKLVSSRPDYRTWLHCKDPKEKALRSEMLRLLTTLEFRGSQVKKTPMPTEMTEVYLTRSSLHIDQTMAFHDFVETLFENFLRDKDDQNMDLLFSFLDMYTRLLTCEIAWSQK